jgi:hypothetical protein
LLKFYVDQAGSEALRQYCRGQATKYTTP